MNKIVVSGYFGFDNSGDDAILKAMVADFKKLNMDLEIIALSKNPEKTKRVYKIEAVDRFSISEVFNTFRDSDLFISGGGSLLQDITSTRSILYYLSVILMAKFLRKKVYVYANGIGPIDKKFNRMITRFVLNKVDYITLRDELSRRFVKNLGVKNENIEVTADPVFSLDAASDERIDEILEIEEIKLSENTIGFCLRDYKNDEGLKKKFAEEIDNLIDAGHDVLLVPFHMPRDNVYSDEILKYTKNKDKLKIIKNNYSAEELMGIFKRLKLLCAMRLHSLIYAANVSLPMVGIIYDPKVEAMIKELGVIEYIDIRNFKVEDLNEKVESALNNHEDRRQTLIKNTNKMKSKSKRNIEIAIELLEK